MTPNILKALDVAGFKAFKRKPSDTWVIFTDGINIGYAQESYYGFVTLSTVHVPNSNTGTGFAIEDVSDLSKANLEKAFMHSPQWAKPSDRASVKKWRSINEYINSSDFNKAYKEVKTDE